MKRDLESISRKNYDLIIIGAGMFGACAAWEAAQRGLSVVLLDRIDFCQATSANHFKMVHGGIRYLQHGDLYRVRESSRERSALLRIAPHLVQPLPIVIPTYGHGLKGKEILTAGMRIYDFTTIDRNKKISDPERKIPRSHFISRKEIINMFPGIDQEKLTGGMLFHDGQMYNPHRVVLSFIHSAVDAGADAANYVEVNDLLIRKERIYGVKARDMLSNNEFEIQANAVLNTSGPWANHILRKSLKIDLDPVPAFSRDAAFVIRKKLNPDFALAVTSKTKDMDAILDRGGRHLFVVPWLDRQYTLVGVWHIVWGKSPNRVFVTDEELQEFIDEVNAAYPAIQLTLDDVCMVNAGLTLFEESTPGSKVMRFGKRSKLVDHERIHSLKGLFTLIGVRATTARGMAEKAISMIAKKIRKYAGPSETEYKPVYGGDIENFAGLLTEVNNNSARDFKSENMLSLLHSYGSKYKEVLKYADSGSQSNGKAGDENLLKAEVIHAIREEMAQKLGDIVFRRTDIGTVEHPGRKTLQQCADIMAGELGCSKSQLEGELDEVENFYRNKGAIKSYDLENAKSKVVS